MKFDHFAFDGVSPFPVYQYTDNDPREKHDYGYCPMTARGLKVQERIIMSTNSITSKFIHNNEELPVYTIRGDLLLFILSMTTGVSFEQNNKVTPCTGTTPDDISQIIKMPNLILRNCTIETVSSQDLYGSKLIDVAERGLFILNGAKNSLQLVLLSIGSHVLIDDEKKAVINRCGYMPHVLNKNWGNQITSDGFEPDSVKVFRSLIVD